MPTYQNISSVTQKIIINRASVSYTYTVLSSRFVHLTSEEVTLFDPESEILQPPVWKLTAGEIPPPTAPKTTTDDVPEGVYNKYYHQNVAKTDLITPYIVDGEINKAPTSNAVYDLMTRQTDYLCGVLTVPYGQGSLNIPCKRGQPLELAVRFSDPDPTPPTCGPIPVDSVSIDSLQITPYPMWAIVVTWDVQNNLREITWEATVMKT